MRQTQLIAIFFPLSLQLGCEPSLIGIGGPQDTSGKGNAAIVPAPDYVAEVRANLVVNKRQEVLKADGDVLLRYKKISGDGYWLTPGSLMGEGDEQLHRIYTARDKAGDTERILQPMTDVSVPIADFQLTDLSVRRVYSFLIRNYVKDAGVASYQRVYITFEPAVIME